MDAELLATSQTVHHIDLLGSTRPDTSWQVKAGQGFDRAHFSMDWQNQQVTCPQGKRSQRWSSTHNPAANPLIHVEFAKHDCLACSARRLCTHAKTDPREITLYPQPIYEALQAARQRQTTPAFKIDYATRAGIEGTLSEGVRAHQLRRSRYIGLAKTHLQHLFVALAINWIRVARWLSGPKQAHTRVSTFAALAPS